MGCETAEVLAERKLRVTILELRDALAADMEIRSRHMLVERLHRHGVKMLLNTRVRNIDGEGKVSIVDPFGRERMLSGMTRWWLRLAIAPIRICMRSLRI